MQRLPNLAFAVRTAVLASVAAALFVTAGCKTDEEKAQEAIEKALDAREKALEARDLQAYGRLVSDGYKDVKKDPITEEESEVDREAILARVSRHLSQFEKINYKLVERTIYLDGLTKAVVVQKFEMEVGAAGKTKRFNGKERFELALEGESWRFTAGI